MGTRYNVSHVSEEAAKEAWANYSKYSYYYTTEIAKTQETLKGTISSAKAKLAAKGMTPENPQYQRELDRITNIAKADVASLQKGYENLQTGAIKKLLTEAPITKYSAGSYQRHVSDIIGARRELGLEDLREGDEYAGEIAGPMTRPRAWEQLESGEYQRVEDPDADYQSRRPEKISAEQYQAMTERAGAPIQSMEAYYTSVWGAYDPHFDVRKEQEERATESARGKAGGRAYTVQTQPKGQPGGGKPGNPFMQTGMEVAEEQAPAEEKGKAWWM